MNNYVCLKINNLSIAIPGYEIVQINLASDIEVKSGISYITYRNDLIPVISFNEELSEVCYGSSHFQSKYVVTLTYPDEDFRPNAHLALQVDLASKIVIKKQGLIPNIMKQPNNPITGWFEDSKSSRGFLTQTAAIEAFVNHATQVTFHERYSTLAG